MKVVDSSFTGQESDCARRLPSTGCNRHLLEIGVAVAGSFSSEDVDRACRYHRPRYRSLLVDAALGYGLLAALAAWPPALGGPWWGRALAFAALALGGVALIRAPVSFWRGLVHERAWGFSTQTALGWLADWAKGLAVSLVLGVGALLGLVALARALPSAWPAAAGPGAALLVLLLSSVAPVLLEPLFNRFEPLPDAGLAEELRALAERAGTPVRDVLVADASRRTRKSNAYVSGLGSTRRVVVFDTLLGAAGRAELVFVLAHELGHRRLRHVASGTVLGAAGAAGSVLVLWALVRDPGDPRRIPLVLLVAAALQLVALPWQSALSRRWERAADRFALDLTRDPPAAEAAFRGLALSNLADLDPPRAAYLLLFSHPTIPERIAAARTLRGA